VQRWQVREERFRLLAMRKDRVGRNGRHGCRRRGRDLLTMRLPLGLEFADDVVGKNLMMSWSHDLLRSARGDQGRCSISGCWGRRRGKREIGRLWWGRRRGRCWRLRV